SRDTISTAETMASRRGLVVWRWAFLLVRGGSAGNTGARHFAVNFQDSRHRISPGKSLRLLIAALFHPFAQRRIKQHPVQRPPDLKHVFRIHQQGRVAHHFRKARSVRSDHRSSMGHGFEWRQSKSLVERWKDKN